MTSDLVKSGARPVKNWLFASVHSFPTIDKIGRGDNIVKHQLRKYGCAHCPIACGGIVAMSDGK